jgi:hypothetical protein
MVNIGSISGFLCRIYNAAVNVTLTPLVRHSTPIRHLGKKIEGQNSTLFHQGLNIISPGTNFFLRFEVHIDR